MPGSNQYDPGSRSLSHQRLLAQARELITEPRNVLMNLSLHAIYKCLGIKKNTCHSSASRKWNERKNGCTYILWLIWQSISAESNRKPNWNNFETAEWRKPFGFNSSYFFLSFSVVQNNTLHPPPWDWLGDLLKYDRVRNVYVENLWNTCFESIVLMALQILPQRNENGAALRSNLCCTRQLLSRSTSHLIRKGQIIHWMSGCRTA